MTDRPVGRPTHAVLTRDRILDAAFALTRTRGAREFSMTALARSLGVRPSALYHYFDGKDDLISAMRGHVTSLVDSGNLDRAPYLDSLSGWARGYLEALLSVPDSIVLLATLPIDGDRASFEDYERVSTRLLAEGWPVDRVVDTLVAIESFIIGSALDALAPLDNLRPRGELLDAAPTFAAAEAARAARAGDPARRSFEIGLRALLLGLREWALGEDDSPPMR